MLKHDMIEEVPAVDYLVVSFSCSLNKKILYALLSTRKVCVRSDLVASTTKLSSPAIYFFPCSRSCCSLVGPTPTV